MPTYRTPDVYVEEVSLLPRSVAEVETAIPAFIGYTATTTWRNTNLLRKPTLVKSLVEFEDKFGSGPLTEVTAVKFDPNLNVVSAAFKNKYYLFEAVRMFFQNGGGKCYISSAGPYRADGTVDKADLSAALAPLAREDEPTLLVAPDAVSIADAPQYHTLMREMLAQAEKLKDRFVVLDVREDGPGDAAAAFRDGIGIKALSYGAAYTPFLKSANPREITYREIRAAAEFSVVKSLAEAPVRALFDEAEAILADANTLATLDLTALSDQFTTRRTALLNVLNAAAPVIATARTEFVNLLTFLYDHNKANVDTWTKAATGLKAARNRDAVKKAITDLLRETLRSLNVIAKAGDAATGAASNALIVAKKPDAAEWGDSFTDATIPAPEAGTFTAVPGGAGAEAVQLANLRKADARINDIALRYLTALASLREDIRAQEAAIERMLVEQFPTYANIVRGVGNLVHDVPPSGAVTGAICYTDSTRGVWKAPANVSLDGVAGVSRIIDSDDQASLNVDANAGKSINAIRPFTGRGILLWGARTLAGNDNEWRYVSVRRFFIMVEESLRKATLWAVFEPNDANLWVKMKGMISNYLTEKWREGALAGAKPEHAFFVNVGLGSTMTPQDILEGRLIVEVGMAAVRPAEFIILRFSHKLQQS